MLKTSQLGKPKRVSLNDLAKVRVSKPEPDNLKMMCGEPLQIDEKGNEYFVIPAHQAEYVSKIFSRYQVSDEFLPDDVVETMQGKKQPDVVIPVSEGNIIETPQMHVEVKKRGNPNWGKKDSQPT